MGNLRAVFGLILVVLVAVVVAMGEADAAGKSAPKSWELPMSFTVVRSSEKDCEPLCPQWLMAEGMLTAESPTQFRAALDRVRGRKLPVVLRSLGGDVMAALDIGMLIRREGLAVTVGRTVYQGCEPSLAACNAQGGIYRGRIVSGDSYCISACPLVLAGGARRLASSAAQIGVHQIRQYERSDSGKVAADAGTAKTGPSPLSPQFKQVMQNILTVYLTGMGVSVKLLDDMEKASGDNWYALRQRSRKDLKLVSERGSAETLLTAKGCAAKAIPDYCLALAN